MGTKKCLTCLQCLVVIVVSLLLCCSDPDPETMIYASLNHQPRTRTGMESNLAWPYNYIQYYKVFRVHLHTTVSRVSPSKTDQNKLALDLSRVSTLFDLWQVAVRCLQMFVQCSNPRPHPVPALRRTPVWKTLQIAYTHTSQSSIRGCFISPYTPKSCLSLLVRLN